MSTRSFGVYHHAAAGPFGYSRGLRVAAVAALGCTVSAVLRRRFLRWGATDHEVSITLAGDEFVPHADVTATRAITIRADAGAVWPWLAQLGQGRGGFYSYDVLENLVGCDVHSADHIVADWQDVQVGDEVKLAPELALHAAVVEPRRALVLRGGIPIGRTPAPYDFTWAFVLLDGPDATTRLVVRERYGYARRWAALIVEPTELISFVMSTRMLRGIKHRAERLVVATPSDAVQAGLDGLAVEAR
jgi:hypothetical protein